MTYTVNFTGEALKALRVIAKADAERIRGKLAALKSDPRPHGAAKLAGSADGRLRIRMSD